METSKNISRNEKNHTSTKDISNMILKGKSVRESIYRGVNLVKESEKIPEDQDSFFSFLEDVVGSDYSFSGGISIPDAHDDGYVESEWNGLTTEYGERNNDWRLSTELDGWMSLDYSCYISFVYNDGSPKVKFMLNGDKTPFINKDFNNMEDFVDYINSSFGDDFSKFEDKISEDLKAREKEEWKDYPDGEGYYGDGEEEDW